MADRFGYGEIGLDIHPCKGCGDYEPPDGCKTHGGCAKPMNNADRIRAMSDEELARYLICDVEAEAIRRCGRYLTAHEVDLARKDCVAWLKSPVEVDG